MAELPPDSLNTVESLCEAGEASLEEGDFESSLSFFQEAWQCLPEPRTDWSCAAFILAAIGDSHFFQSEYLECKNCFMSILRDCGGSTGNPFIRLRLGQCLYELGDHDEAANWLAGAFLLEGKKLFEDEDPKYLNFVKVRLEPPPGGWSEGW